MALSFKEIEELYFEVECAPYELFLGCDQCADEFLPCHTEEHTWFIQAMLWRQDADTKEWGWGHGSKYIVDPNMSVEELVKKFFVACRDYAEHEVREAFKWRGRRVLGPHVSLSDLWIATGE